MNKLRVLIADDERPAREFLKSLLGNFDDVEIVGAAENGADALETIKEKKPDLALLDLQMPECSGIEVVRQLRKSQMPLVAFVTAFDEYAVEAFEVGAVDYLLKPVEKQRLAETIERAHEQLERTDWRERETEKIRETVKVYDAAARPKLLEQLPVKNRDEILLVPVREIVSIVADGELLYITTVKNQKYIINFRLKDLESRLSEKLFIRLSRGSIVNLKLIEKIVPQTGGTFLIRMRDGQQITSSRLQSRILRERLLKNIELPEQSNGSPRVSKGGT